MLIVRGNKPIKTVITNVKKDDTIVVANGQTATVKCLIKIARNAAKPLLCMPGGLTITPRHPVRVNGIWTHPINVTKTKVANPSGFVYNIVLDQHHVPLINGVECITWGHGLTAEGVKHPYFGTEKIINDLAALPGWNEGLVQVQGDLRTRKT